MACADVGVCVVGADNLRSPGILEDPQVHCIKIEARSNKNRGTHNAATAYTTGSQWGMHFDALNE